MAVKENNGILKTMTVLTLYWWYIFSGYWVPMWTDPFKDSSRGDTSGCTRWCTRDRHRHQQTTCSHTRLER